MKNRLKFVVVLALLVAALPLAAFAQGPDSAPDVTVTYTTGFQLQNLSAIKADPVSIMFYNQDGTVAATVNDSINGNSSKTYYPLECGFKRFQRVGCCLLKRSSGCHHKRAR